MSSCATRVSAVDWSRLRAKTLISRSSTPPLVPSRGTLWCVALSPGSCGHSIWSELGIEVEITTPTMASFLATDQHNEGLDLRLGRWNPDYDDPDNFTYGLFHSHVGLYRSYISSAEGDHILEEARAESQPSVRAALYRKYENFLLEAGMLLPLFHDVDYRLANPKVRGLKLQSRAPHVNYAELGKVEAGTAAIETVRMGGGIIQVPIAGVINSLDPALAAFMEQGETLPNIFE